MPRRTRLIREYLNNLKTDKEPLDYPNFVIERLLKNTRLNANGCWIRGDDSSIYTKVVLPNETRLAHRVSYEMFTGIRLKHQACHNCDTPACINPDHIFDGTQSDNMQDARNKGRLKAFRFDSQIRDNTYWVKTPKSEYEKIDSIKSLQDRLKQVSQ